MIKTFLFFLTHYGRQKEKYHAGKYIKLHTFTYLHRHEKLFNKINMEKLAHLPLLIILCFAPPDMVQCFL